MKDLQLAFIGDRTMRRLFQILDTIERERTFTIGELALTMNVTQRTIASDIKVIKGYFEGCILLDSGPKGFFFKEIQPRIYREKKQKLLENECLFDIIGNIFQGKFENVDELAYRYHFSETSFRRLLKQSSQLLESYELRWNSNPLTIEGSEANLRKFFKDFYYEGVDTAFTVFPDEELHDFVLKKVGSKLGHYKIGSGTTIEAFYYTIYIAIKRASIGCTLTLPKDLAELAYQGENFSLLYSLKKGINEIYGTELSKEEFAWIYLVTICKRTVDNELREKRFYEYFNRGIELHELTKEYLNSFDIPEEHYSPIYVCLRSFFLSRKINHLIAPVLNKEADDIKKRVIEMNPTIYQHNLQFLKENKERFSLSDKTTRYLEDISVSLTIYSSLILDFYWPSKTICFLLEGDHFVCQQIRIRAIQQFGTKHELIFLPLQDLIQERLNDSGIDLIVTNYNRYLLDYINDTEYLLLKDVPDEQDWQHLARIIDPYRRSLF
ncbi:helix-turn-helix domain-containing protein [Enterococcus entomosocium]|uniref:helix-turn-helix domain-containing protein n=1 Tax=Enterococcus entomosocium TaxID=3034352 RepID=UPI00279555B5|nr:helix-turn-helix domain-containing protein [Enterococcus entomosocium]